MKSKIGLTLVETLIAITLFGVLSAATAGLMLSSISLRTGNQRSLQGEQFVKKILEKHKDYWSVLDNYDSIPNYVSNNLLSEIPANMTVEISYSCMDADGDMLGPDSSTLNCELIEPPLRRVHVTLLRGEKLLASQDTDIGRPITRKAGP